MGLNPFQSNLVQLAKLIEAFSGFLTGLFGDIGRDQGLKCCHDLSASVAEADLTAFSMRQKKIQYIQRRRWPPISRRGHMENMTGLSSITFPWPDVIEVYYMVAEIREIWRYPQFLGILKKDN
jgi:hypothetical protein